MTENKSDDKVTIESYVKTILDIVRTEENSKCTQQLASLIYLQIDTVCTQVLRDGKEQKLFYPENVKENVYNVLRKYDLTYLGVNVDYSKGPMMMTIYKKLFPFLPKNIKT